ncbi:MAG: PAS domain-containing sensor histidine kinase [Bacteroidota bacterium]
MKSANSELNAKRLGGQLEVLMKNLPDLILSINLKGDITYSNKPVFEINPSDIIGHNISEIFGMDMLEKYLNYLKNAKGISPTQEETYEFNRSFFNWRLLPVNWSGEGEVLMVARNVSKKIALRNALIDSQLNFEGFVQALPGVAYRKELGKDGRESYTFISHRIRDLTGYAVEEFMTDKIRWSELIEENDKKRVFEQAKFISTEKPGFSIEYKISTKYGEKLWLLNQAHTTFKNNRAVRREGVILDITNQKESELEVYELNKELKELKFAIDNTSLVTITNIKGRIKYVNNKFIEISGYSREESIGQKHNLINSSYHSSEFWVNLWTTISAGKIWNGEIRNRAKNGGIYWVNTYIVPIKDSKNEIKEYLSIRNDITEKKQQEEENKLLSLVAKETSNYVVITDENRNIEWVNEAFERETGYKLEKIKGKSPSDFLQGEGTSKKTIEDIRSGLKAQKSFTTEILNYTIDNKPFWVSINFQPVFDENGKLIKYFSLMRNVTTYKELIDKLEKAVEKAEKSDQLKTTFLANISHEVRTPMNAIIGFSELLSMKTVSEDKVKYFSNIINQRSKDLLSIFNDMLDTSKLVSGQVQLNITTGCLDNLFKKIYNIHADSNQKLKSNRVSLKVNVDIKESELLVNADFIKLHQVLENLITNAIKFTEKGSIEFGCKKTEPHKILFYVSDTGIGMDPSLHPYIFEAFRQIEDTHLSHGGSGLGLSICKGYVDLMGGEIWFESEVNKGTTFYFSIPIN